jgi:hypothetical protein
MVSFGDLARLEIAFQARGVPLWVMGIEERPRVEETGRRPTGGVRKRQRFWARGGVGPME